ncbi:MAG: MATE family efflux transporter [Thomasclavelia sp.]|jgi:putative MATE family efflux protein|nr:MATE family efflux transporter [Thomasclavelia sp.]
MKNDLLKGNVFKTLIAFAIPFLLSNLLQILYGSADLFVVGRFATTADVSGVSIGSQTMTLFTQFILGLTTGITILLGRYYGSNKIRELSKTVGASIALFTILGAILTVVIYLFHSPLVLLMNTPKEALSNTKNYLSICSLGFIFIIGYNVVSAILRGIGNSKTPLLFVFIACVINVVLDFILVGGFRMGVAGAAIATVGAQGFSFLFSLIYLKKRGIGFRLYKEDISLSSKINTILKVGMPLGLQSALVSVSFLFITVVINGMGVVASAAVGVDEKLIEFLMLPSIAFGSAISTMVAQNVAANQLNRAKETTIDGIKICMIFACFVVTITQLFPHFFPSLFTSDYKVIEQASLYMRTYSIDCLCTSLMFCLNGYLNGQGATMFTMVHSLISSFTIRIPMTYLISTIPKISILYLGIAAPTSSIISLIMIVIYLRINNMSLRKN